MVYRSRLYIVLGFVGCALALLFRDSLLPVAVLFAALVVVLVEGARSMYRLTGFYRRPAAFTVTSGQFRSPVLYSPAVTVMLVLVLLGLNIAMLLDEFTDPNQTLGVLDWIMLGLVYFTAVVVLPLAVLAWSMATSGVALTPEGVVWRALWYGRTIPWEALSPGGPLRPGSNEVHMRLVFTRPELVRRRGLRLLDRPDRLTTQTEVHPWLLADAIRWYVEHPEHRAAIGTEAEHARLVSAVGADVPRQPVSPPEPPPPVVRTAIRLGFAGVAFGLLTAVLDVALVFGFEDRLKAHARAVGEREVRDFGVEPVDWESSVSFSQDWLVTVLLSMVLAAAAALACIRLLKRGNEFGRIGLAVVSIAAAGWATMLCFDVALEPPPDLASLFIAVTVLKRLGYLGLGVATLVLLMLPASRAFTRQSPA